MKLHTTKQPNSNSGHFDFWFWVLLIILVLMGIKYNNAHDVIPALKFGNPRQVTQNNQSQSTGNHGANQQSTSGSPRSNSAANSVNTNQHQYSTRTTAAAHTGYQSKSEMNGMNRINLGNNQTGYVDHGAGQTYIVFYVGKWSIKVHGSRASHTGTTPQAMAQRLATYFHTHRLPTNDTGSLNVNANNYSTSLSYQKNGKTVVNDRGNNVDRILQRV